MATENTEVTLLERQKKREVGRLLTLKMFIYTITLISLCLLVWQLFTPNRTAGVGVALGIIFLLSAVASARLIWDPDSVRAHQSDLVLKLARQIFACLTGGLDDKAAQKICELLLPTTEAVAVAISDQNTLIGFASNHESLNREAMKGMSQKLNVQSAKASEMVIIDDFNYPTQSSRKRLKAVIVVPLFVGSSCIGSLRFHYTSMRKISATQESIAEGFGALISTQLAAQALEEQTKLATSMELKALQNQINPHFLFNTINTIASLIRTDPAKARILLREFAVFYRRTLEDSDDLILLSREAEQTVRYFQFELARFGADRLELVIDEEEGVRDMLVPPFLIQPLVENAVRHAMPSEGKLTIVLSAWVDGDYLKICVADDGVGMTKEVCDNIMHPESSTGMGIAVKNVHDRIVGYFGDESGMDVESEPGKGTRVTLSLSLRAIERYVR